MSSDLHVSISKQDAPSGHCDLVIRALDGTGRSWKKQYDGNIFIGLDAESLGLLESARGNAQGGPRLRLRREADLDPERLLRLGFRQI